METHLVDGTYELFRHHFAVPSHADPNGMEVAAVRGVLGSMLMLLESGATHVGVATDQVVESFRNDLWIGYKTSDGMEPVLLAQFPLLEDALPRARRSRVGDGRVRSRRRAWHRQRASPREDPRVERAYICTPDKDLGQCVVDPVVAQFDRRQERVIDEAGVREKFGVGPASIPDYLALVGDTADGFPGLPGWGAKSAAMVLARYEHIDGIPDDVSEWDVQPRGAAKLAATLAAARDAAQPVPRPRDAAHRRRRRQGRRLGVARARARAGGVGGAAGRARLRDPRTVSRSKGGEANGESRADRREVHVLGTRRRPRRRRPRAAAARVPGDVVRVAGADPGARGRGLPRRRAGSTRVRRRGTAVTRRGLRRPRAGRRRGGIRRRARRLDVPSRRARLGRRGGVGVRGAASRPSAHADRRLHAAPDAVRDVDPRG